MTPFDRLRATQCDFFWVPPDARVVDRDEIAYLACPRDLAYVNTVTRTTAPPERLPTLIAEVLQAQAGVRSSWMVFEEPGSAALEAALTDAGYREHSRYDAMVVRTDAFRPRPSSAHAVEVTDMAALRDWHDVHAAAFGDRMLPDDETLLRRDLEHCTRPGRRTLRFVARDGDGRPLASASMNTYPDLDLCFFWGGGTAPEARGQGAYSALVAARVAVAAALGAELVGIFARLETSAPIVAKQGFEVVGRKAYWGRPAD